MVSTTFGITFTITRVGTANQSIFDVLLLFLYFPATSLIADVTLRPAFPALRLCIREATLAAALWGRPLSVAPFHRRRSARFSSTWTPKRHLPEMSYGILHPISPSFHGHLYVLSRLDRFKAILGAPNLDLEALRTISWNGIPQSLRVNYTSSHALTRTL